MNMKHSIVIVAAMAISFAAKAQSLEEGIKMYKYERYESAMKALTPLASANSMANYYLGLSELALDHKSEAKTTFAKFPEDAANMSGLARVAYAENNPAEGNRLVQIVADKAKRKEWEPLKYAADAINYSEGGNIQQAIDWYKKALEKEDNADLHIALGDAYQKIQGGGGQAMNNYENVTAKDPKNSLAYSRIGALWYAAKNYTLALENYQKAKDADPSNPLPYSDLANAYFYVGKYDLAKQNIEKYLELSDKSTEDQIRYGNILYLSKNYPAAIQKMQELLNKGVVKPGFYGILAYSQMETKDTANALINVRKYFAIQDPKKIFPLDYLNYGRIMMDNNMTDSADYYFGKAVAADTSKDKSDIYRQIAEGFKAAKDYPKSAEWYNKLITANPDAQPLDYFWWGAMYYYSRDYEKAGKAFEAMETKYPEQQSAIYWRGRVAAATDEEGKTCVAKPHYTRWLEKVGPDYEKKGDLMQAYQYLALCALNSNDKDNLKKYMDKIEELEPENSFLKQLKEAISKSSKPSGKK